MDAEQFEAEMSLIKETYSDDEEALHIAYDNLMCEVLRGLGYGKGIDIFESSTLWYA